MKYSREPLNELRKELIECMVGDNTLDKTNCVFELLREITILQDEVQLNLPKPNESIALSQTTINDANAIILELSKWKGDIPRILENGYATEKVRSLPKNYNDMIHDYNISRDEDLARDGIVCTSKGPITNPEEEVQEYMHDTIFRNIQYDPSTQKLVQR